jgi:hypothetical protein
MFYNAIQANFKSFIQIFLRRIPHIGKFKKVGLDIIQALLFVFRILQVIVIKAVDEGSLQG